MQLFSGALSHHFSHSSKFQSTRYIYLDFRKWPMIAFFRNNVYIGSPTVVTERSLVEGLLEKWMVEQTGHDIIWQKQPDPYYCPVCNICMPPSFPFLTWYEWYEKTPVLWSGLSRARKAIKWESFWLGPHWGSFLDKGWFVSSLPISYYTSAHPTFADDDEMFRQVSYEVMLEHSSL